MMSEHSGVPDRQFEDIIPKLPAYLRELAESAYLHMDSPAQRRSLRSALPGCQGVYILYEHDRPMYVGLWGAIIPNEANPDSDHSGSNIVALQCLPPTRGEAKLDRERSRELPGET